MGQDSRQQSEPQGRDSTSATRNTASEGTPQLYEFGPFRLDPYERRLQRGNEIVPLPPRAFDTLLVLVRNSGHLLEKEELIRMLWPDSFVEEGSLSNNIFLLRKALGEDPVFIETVPRRGYRFVGAVRQFPQAVSARLENPPEDGRQRSYEMQVDWLAQSAPAEGIPPKGQLLWRSRATATIAALVLLATLAATLWYYKWPGRSSETIDSVAVLPFVNPSADPNTEYLSDGITESLINSLTQFRGLRVMARSAVFRFKGRDADPQKIGRELQVRAVLTGQLLQRGDTLIVQVELVDVEKGARLWGAQYNRKLADVLVVQEDIAQEISQSLRLRLTGDDQKRLAKRYSVNSEAYQDYPKGRFWCNKQTEEGFNKGIQFFQQAIAKDAGYAQAYSGLADCYSSLAESGVTSAKDGYLKAKDAALKAVELDDTLAEAHTSLGVVKTSYDWDWSGADKEFQRAIALNPSYADAHGLRAETLWETGRLDEAIRETKLALELDPLSLPNNAALGQEFFLARQYDQTIEQERKVLELDPNSILAYYFSGIAYLKKSMFEEGMADLKKAMAIAPTDEIALTGLGYGYGVTGKRAETERVLDKLRQLSKQRYVSPVWMAKIYAGLADKDKSLEWLEKAYEDRSIVSIGFIKTNPMLDPLRADPRFVDLLRRTGLTP